jgi:hypothetical protein
MEAWAPAGPRVAAPGAIDCWPHVPGPTGTMRRSESATSTATGGGWDSSGSSSDAVAASGGCPYSGAWAGPAPGPCPVSSAVSSSTSSSAMSSSAVSTSSSGGGGGGGRPSPMPHSGSSNSISSSGTNASTSPSPSCPFASGRGVARGAPAPDHPRRANGVYQAWAARPTADSEGLRLSRRALRRMGRAWSLGEVAKHNVAEDAWIAVNGRVSNWAARARTVSGSNQTPLGVPARRLGRCPTPYTGGAHGWVRHGACLLPPSLPSQPQTPALAAASPLALERGTSHHQALHAPSPSLTALPHQVYDITEHVVTHPGWEGAGVSTVLSILAHLGTDCSQEFAEIHRPYPVAWRQLAAFDIGPLEEST